MYARGTLVLSVAEAFAGAERLPMLAEASFIRLTCFQYPFADVEF